MLFSELIQKVIIKLSEVPGSGVQTYSEDKIAAVLQEQFNLLYDEAVWDQFVSYHQKSLDGSTGTVTVNFDSTSSWNNIIMIFRGNTDVPIPVLPSNVNPYGVTGDRRFVQANSNTQKLFTVWPRNSTGTVTVKLRTKPADFDATDEVDFDADLLINWAAWVCLESDGTNPSETQRLETFAKARLAQLKKKLNNKPIALNPYNGGSYPTDWYVMQ